MYAAIDDWIGCSMHGCPVQAAIHVYTNNGDLSSPKYSWLVCIHCAELMDSDPAFKLSMGPLFDEYQRVVQGIPGKARWIQNRPVTYTPYFVKAGRES